MLSSLSTCATGHNDIARIQVEYTQVQRSSNNAHPAIHCHRSLKVRTIAFFLVLLMLQGCASTVIGTTVGAVTTLAVETAKVPFKVAGAAIDVVTDDEDEDEED
jgi:uncharacterized membrane protein